MIRGSRFTHDYGLFAHGVVFDPFTLTAGSMAASAAGGGLTAASTLAGGNYAAAAGDMAKAAADYKAGQIRSNAAQAFASNQRQALDIRHNTDLTMSASRARAAAGGVNAADGSAVTNEGEIAERGEYQALMKMFNGESEKTGLLNEAQGVEYSGEMARMEGQAKQNASYLSAAGTIAGSAGSMMKTYSNYAYPTLRGAA